LLKLSGEALMGRGSSGIDPAAVAGLADEIAAAKGQGHELCLVVGGGNIFPRHGRRRQGASTAPAPITWDAGDGDERARPPERA
jgi:uridylate kinase